VATSLDVAGEHGHIPEHLHLGDVGDEPVAPLAPLSESPAPVISNSHVPRVSVLDDTLLVFQWCSTPGCPYRAASGKAGPLTEDKGRGLRCCPGCVEPELLEPSGGTPLGREAALAQPAHVDQGSLVIQSIEQDSSTEPVNLREPGAKTPLEIDKAALPACTNDEGIRRNDTPPLKVARVCGADELGMAHACQATAGHDADCPRLSRELLQECWWERIQNLSPEASEEAACMVVPPRGFHGFASDANCGSDGQRYPVILFLTGKGHINGREDFLWGGVDVLLRNPRVRDRCVVIAPLPTTGSGLLRREADGWGWTWDEDRVWAVFMEVLKRFGSSRIDWCRLYATGPSLGASAVWHLALRYGQYLAAIAPISGACQWPGNSWPRDSKRPDENVLSQLSQLAVRAYHIDIDKRAGHPGTDIKWLTWLFGLEETSRRDLVLPGMEAGQSDVKVDARSWSSSTSGGALLELWQVAGPIHDWSCWGDRGDNHCLWYRVYPLQEYEFLDWLLGHSISEERCWRETTQ